MASIMEGPLSKWTNVMKGWQYRWFVLDYNAGLLSYYTVSPRRQSPERLGGRDPWVEVGTGRFGSWEEVARLGGAAVREGSLVGEGFTSPIANEGERDAGSANKRAPAL